MKKAIVLGATSGIGRQLSVLLANENCLVGATGRRKVNLEELQAMHPENIVISDFDITDTSEVSQRLNELVTQLGGLDLVILNSGVGDFNPDLDFSIEKKTIDVNVLGFTKVADWTFNFFDNQGFGHLVAITSVGGLRGSREAPAYNATKAFQINYLEGLRQKAKYIKKPIYITDVRPGFVDTEMAKGEGVFWMATVEKASSQILTAIKNKKSVSYVTKRWKAIATILKIIPRPIYNKM
jgi:short-subunit dehydrogenase